MVTRELPASVYRCKGIVYTDEAPDAPLALQAVGRRTDLAPLQRFVGSGVSEVVAIGRDIDGAELDRLFTATLAPGSHASARNG
jgi:G3E family GTPase